MENRYSPLRRLLSTRRERPQNRRTTEQANEFAPPHLTPHGLEMLELS